MPVVESSGAPVATAVFFTGHDTVVYSIGRPTAGVCKTTRTTCCCGLRFGTPASKVRHARLRTERG